LHTRLKIPLDIQIDERDLCVLLGNAIDNAMEAVEPLTENLRDIYVEMEYNLGILSIQIKNRYQGELQWLEYGKRLKSKKQEVGLPSMSKIATKYHGRMDISQNDGFYILNIWLYG